jgi:hypothetical protein
MAARHLSDFGLKRTTSGSVLSRIGIGTAFASLSAFGEMARLSDAFSFDECVTFPTIA